mmetsp:Transcript_30940/g.69711  ORF Transcript_30940/g.69711 Transcript_30940/m.69711 type:complete len:444 (-) Transcript_30940:1378-2709(-)
MSVTPLAHGGGMQRGQVEYTKPERLVDFLCSRIPMSPHVLPDVHHLDEKLRLRYGPDNRASALLVGSGWEGLPSFVDPAYHLPESRRLRKRQQLMSIFRAVAPLLLCPIGGAGKLKLVDFCGGGGHVGLLFAFLFPDMEVVCVDKKFRSLDFGMQRAQEVSLSNYRTVESDVMDFNESFDVGVSLHACGPATDMVIAACLRTSAPLVVCSCCVGKIGQPPSPRSQRQPESELKQPVWDEAKGSSMRALLREYASLHGEDGDDEHNLFVRLAKAADYNQLEFTSLTVFRMFAKLLIELDRLQGILEYNISAASYNGILCKMEPLCATPKNDILVAWPRRFAVDVMDFRPDKTSYSQGTFTTLKTQMDACDDTAIASVMEIRQKLVAFNDDPNQTCLTFDEVNGGKSRKLVHSEAERLGLQHSSEGKGKARKVVVKKALSQHQCS